jgi:hypothetical protein
MSIQKILERGADKIYFHPRTGERIIGCTAGDRVHKMPKTRKTHLNGCPRIAYHRRVNQPHGTGGTGKPTGQLKTIWGGEQGNYAGFFQILAGNDKGNRFLPPQRESKSARCGNREWKRL